ncbi:MAG: hypothetical protein C6W58_14565, partial [Bacillaceae bacterium]
MDRSHICIFIQNFDKDILQPSVFFSCRKHFIEGHHTIPVSELEEGQLARIEDIFLVCSICHRM